MSNNNTLVSPAALTAIIAGDLDNALIAATPGGIERQEKTGQEALTSNFERLPREYRHREDSRAILEKLGFIVGEPLDELFVRVTPPDGWVLVPTDHSMWSDLFDAQGRKRGGVFYKAAFYDRRADLRIDTRYAIVTAFEHDSEPSKARIELQDRASGAVLDHGEWREIGEWAAEDADRQRLVAVLKERFPLADDETAYWDAASEPKGCAE